MISDPTTRVIFYTIISLLRYLCTYLLLILAKVTKNFIYRGLLFFVAMKLRKSMKPFQSTSLAILLFYSNGLTNTFYIYLEPSVPELLSRGCTYHLQLYGFRLVLRLFFGGDDDLSIDIIDTSMPLKDISSLPPLILMHMSVNAHPHKFSGVVQDDRCRVTTETRH